MFLKCLKKTRSNSHEMWQYVLQVLRLIFLLSGHYEAHRVLGVLINCFLLGRGGGGWVIIRIVKKSRLKINRQDMTW